MRDIEGSIELPVPASQASSLWSAVEKVPLFSKHVLQVTATTAGHTYWELTIGGVEWDFDAVVTGREPGAWIEWASESGDLILSGRSEFLPLTDSSCELRVSVHWMPVGLLEKVGAVLADDRRVLRMHLEDFRTYVETQISAPETAHN